MRRSPQDAEEVQDTQVPAGPTFVPAGADVKPNGAGSDEAARPQRDGSAAEWHTEGPAQPAAADTAAPGKLLQELRADIASMQDQLRRGWEEIRGELDDFHVAAWPENRPQRKRWNRIREVLKARVPGDALSIMVSKGNEDLPAVYGCKPWVFPLQERRSFAGQVVPASTTAIIQLESLRGQGAEYLLIPGPSWAWLDEHDGFQQHLRSRYHVVFQEEGTCLLVALRESCQTRATTWQAALDDVIRDLRYLVDRDPAILDWHTGLALSSQFPRYTIFSPPTGEATLPYLDHSVDVVAVRADASDGAVAEALRVASVAVLALSTDGRTDKVEIRWQASTNHAGPPSTSIVIPVYNAFAHTRACLRALHETLPRSFAGEIIVVDDASTDESFRELRRLAGADERLRVLRNPSNLGFVMSCNRGAEAATGDLLVFLNNDTLPQPGWLDALWRTFREYEGVGVVGSKLVFPDGRLQEAGGVILSDGGGANFGRGDFALDEPLYNYVREVDYCSGAVLATPRPLFLEMGGFDERFSPGYYEETDYCFRAWDKGYRVLYQPQCVVIHVEGASFSGDKNHFQTRNRGRFIQRWRERLRRQPPTPEEFALPAWHALAVRADEGATGP